MGFLEEARNVIGDALRAVHSAGGFKADYVLHTDVTSPTVYPKSAKSTLTIPMWPMPEARQRQEVGGRWQDVLTGGGGDNQGAHVFVVSRNVLVVDGEFFEPTLMDTFQKLAPCSEGGAVFGPTYYVQQISNIGVIPGAWYLTCGAQFRDHARG